jgi:nucleoside-diphosphate-sugar epimerase
MVADGATEHRRAVVVTGAAGRIGSLVMARLGDRWQIRATDVLAGAGIEQLDVTDQQRCREVFEGSDAVLHLAANPSPGAGWEALRGPNVDGAHAVAAAARECGVRRLVLASSVWAVAGYPGRRQRRAADPPLPVNLYGASKAWAEALGSWVASTSDTSVVALRIGYFPGGPPPADAELSSLALWLSPDDCTRLIRASVETELTGFTIVNGISANRHPMADLGDEERGIGFEPADDAWDFLDRDT